MFGMNDPFFNMLNYDPFAPPQASNQRANNTNQLATRDPFAHHHMMMQNMMTPFGGGGGGRNNPFSMMNNMMSNMHRMMEPPQMMNQHIVHADPSSQVYSSSSVMTYSNTGDGRPKIYQASQQMRQGPDGVRETRNLERDSERGIERMAVGHHIGDRAHIIERQKVNGQIEETVNLENLDDEDLAHFNQEFEQKATSHFKPSHRSTHHHHLSSGRDPQFAIDHDGSSARKSSRDNKKSKSSKSSKH